jgi:hypothetical protein
MDLTKLRASLAPVRAAVQEAVNAAVAEGNKGNVIAINGIGPLVKINALLDKAASRIDEAVERTTPKVKEVKDEKKAAGKTK